MNVLINRSDAIGDTILTLPLAQLIKEIYPNSKVYFLLQKNNEALLLHNPFVDKILVYNRNESLLIRFKKLINTFKALSIDHYLYVGGDNLPSLLAFFYRVKFRGGLRKKLNHFLFLNKGVWQRRSRVKMHEGMYNIKLLESIGTPIPSKMIAKISLPLKLCRVEVEKGAEKLKSMLEVEVKKRGFNLATEYIVIHPGMKGSALNWPSEFYLQLISYIEQKIPSRFNYIISFTTSDLPYVVPIRKLLESGNTSENTNENGKIKDKIFFLNGEDVGTRGYMAILSNSKLFIGPSTGTTHMANALGVDLVAIYSPVKVQSFKRWGPFFNSKIGTNNSSGKVKVLVPLVNCQSHFKCDPECIHKGNCMSLLKVESVGQQVLIMLKEQGNFSKV
ncbi:MAG: glycosyltransferase family 9 protein [Oligoflexia bacterium]|nr:glycosyltransferase family 9 protein [Oligoflexia bacterium]